MDKEIKKLFVAVKALIVKDQKVLILSEVRDKDSGTNPGKFDFPGGKMELGEEPREALIREVKEETGLEVEIGTPIEAINLPIKKLIRITRKFPHRLSQKFRLQITKNLSGYLDSPLRFS